MKYISGRSWVKSLVFHLLVDYKNVSAVLKLERGSIENSKWVIFMSVFKKCILNNGQAEVKVLSKTQFRKPLEE